MKLSVVIVNYNVKHYLWQCLDSVCRASRTTDTEIWIVDNASSDGSIDYLQKEFPEGEVCRQGAKVEVHYIVNRENVGFSRANNQAIRRSAGDVVLLLNPDTFVAENTLASCLQFFETHGRAGALGVHMVNRDGSFAKESRRGLPTPSTSFYKVSGLCHFFPTHPRFAHYYMGHLEEFSPARIEVISGAFMMLRKEALNDAGLLDEDYFMYGEDIDMSYRVGLSGWECWYIPEQILHYKGESTQKTSFKYVHNFYHAMLIFFHKHFARRYWLAWFIVEMAVYVMGLLSLMRTKFLVAMARLRGKVRSLMNRQEAPQKLAFIGSDASWDVVKGLCRHAGITAEHIGSIDDVDDSVSSVAFELSEEGCTYLSAIEQMTMLSNRGLSCHIGMYHPKNQILILPNAILC